MQMIMNMQIMTINAQDDYHVDDTGDNDEHDAHDDAVHDDDVHNDDTGINAADANEDVAADAHADDGDASDDDAYEDDDANADDILHHHDNVRGRYPVLMPQKRHFLENRNKIFSEQLVFQSVIATVPTP